jgi:hypothetical protein|tara:strand:- start:216 stop:392 length:177 start_codon:yes stop_codon:yes gene_type:complete
MISDKSSRLVVTGYGSELLALGLIKTRRALDIADGTLKTNFEALNINFYFLLSLLSPI